MKAAVVHDFTKPLSFEDVPKPEPGPGEVLVKIETAGLCHTDIHAAHGDWPVKPTPRSSPVTKVSGSSSRSDPASARRRWATGSPCRGSARRAESATTASRVGDAV